LREICTRLSIEKTGQVGKNRAINMVALSHPFSGQPEDKIKNDMDDADLKGFEPCYKIEYNVISHS
jgi:hypothetical protein